MANIPDKPTLDGIESRWAAQWQADGTYDFDASAPRERVFAIDTPPPTVSGSLHMGHVFSYTHTDIVARFQRMSGKPVFYPIGWDDNGLPTERRVQNYYGVRCDPTQQYVEGFEPPFRGDAAEGSPAGAGLATELHRALRRVGRDRRADLRSRAPPARAVVRLVVPVRDDRRALAARQPAGVPPQPAPRRGVPPGSADAVGHRLPHGGRPGRDGGPRASGRVLQAPFHRSDGAGDVEIDTTRPELVAACVALVAHPDDERYQPLFGSTVRTPLYGVEVPILAHELAEPDKGTGIAMICTFGDTTDVTWWRELALEMRPIIGRDGRILPAPPSGVPAEPYAAIAGLSVAQAQKKVVEQLVASGETVGEPRPITHAVKFYERGSRPLEIVTSRQWYIRNGGRDPELRGALVKRGGEVTWHPAHMQHRYDNWVEGLNGDWLISRQRFFGVPIPVWYRLDDSRRARLRRAAHPRRVAVADRPLH